MKHQMKFGLLLLGIAVAMSPLVTGQTTVEAASTSAKTVTVSKQKKQVTLICEVNGTYFTEPTRHGIVSSGGTNASKALLRTKATPAKVYRALKQIGAKPGNNLTAADMSAAAGQGKKVKGTVLDVSVKWRGQREIPFHKILKANHQYTADYRFGGNLASAKKNNTGCVLCLDSCATGIVSDAAWPTGSTQHQKVTFRGNEKVLPKDGTQVKVVFSLADCCG